MRVLNNRIWREFRAHFGRYLALFFMIVLGMYLVVSVAGMAETTIQGSREYNDRCRLQDGQFTTFVPLTDTQLTELERVYGDIEKIFSIDIEVDNTDIIRVFRKRKKINLLNLDEGRKPEKDDEIVIMNLYAQRNAVRVGDPITLAGREYTVCGVGCVPDYNLTVKNFSDMTADPENFGIAIVSDEGYDALLHSGKTGGEAYTYSYKLAEGADAKQLKEAVKDIDFDYKSSGNEYLIEYVDRLYKDKTDFEEGLTELIDGTNDLYDGIVQVSDGASELKEAVKENNTGFELLKATPFEALTQITDGYLKAARELNDGTDELLKGAEDYKEGVWEFNDEVRDFLDENLTADIANLESFYENKDNPRIASDAASDVVLKKLVSLVAGAILVMLFAYVISVFIIHQINEESSIIGTLYAMGIKRRTLTLHYIMLPTLVTFIAGLAGMLIGFSCIGVDFQMQDSYLYYSLPHMDKVFPLYIVIYCVVMPPCISILVNTLVIRKKLARTALSLIKNEQADLVKGNGGTFIVGRKIRSRAFLGQFSKRQMMRERRSVFTVVTGMVVALLIFMIGLDCYVLCDNVRKENLADINYEYMYIYKYPTKEVPKGGEACFVKNLTVDYLDYSLDVNLIGIDKDNPYYAFKTSGNKKDIVIASSTAQKYDLKTGDTFILEDTSEDMKYAFTVSEIVPYSIGLTAYLDIDEMREMFGESDDYYNMVLSDKDLGIDGGRLSSVSKRSDIENAAGIFVDQMMSLIVILIVVSILIFIAVMFLMLNVMIDRAVFGISLVKIFGYRMKEIRRVYLDGNFYAVMIGACIGIPVVKKIADMIYPYFIANTAMGMNLHFEWPLYGAVILGIIMIYIAISSVLTEKIKKIVPAEVLKNRE
ncbi:MAG: FtsX-like permease family protein [Lachnospiraceae bacterium]|nr:FtsX-like permease family protein [Lachnospiraceae bacterium]